MVPRAKKNLHECAYHLDKMRFSSHVEELAINFAAFVNSARNVTFVLQKEFNDNAQFISWYGNADEKSPRAGTKRHQMKNDELSSFFKESRNNIVKEGSNGFICQTRIAQFNSTTDLLEQPPGSSVQISGDGIYYLICKGTSQEDRVPAKSKAKITTKVGIANPPKTHLGQPIPETERDILNLSNRYYQYLISVVEEWTGIMNS